jgi:two-component system nitrogen regulation response regulator GlnG
MMEDQRDRNRKREYGMSYVMIVDDEPSICWGFEQLLGDEGHEVRVAASAEEALRLSADRAPDAIVLDVRLPGMDGLTAIGHFRSQLGNVPIVVVTAFGNLEVAVKAVHAGAFDYLHKPFDLDQAAQVVERALLSGRPSEPESSEPKAHADAVSTELIGASPAMQRVFKQIAWVANSHVPVLITGESGTGKELVARAIHRHSQRSEAPFLPVCLAALSEGVIESELFGHVKGAFTGATQDRLGLLELAEQGAVFLDEIGDTSLPLQVKLLRALEQKEITPVGDARPRAIGARILAATNRPLRELIERGDFREDLYFRLSVFEIHLPPLRERREDIPALVERFALAAFPDMRTPLISDEAIKELKSRDWPGNVRELRNAIEHAVIVSRGEMIRGDHLPAANVASPPASQGAQEELRDQIRAWTEKTPDSLEAAELYEAFLKVVEPPFLEALLKKCHGNKAACAQVLGIHRSTLRQKLRKYGMEEPTEP